MLILEQKPYNYFISCLDYFCFESRFIRPYSHMKVPCRIILLWLFFVFSFNRVKFVNNMENWETKKTVDSIILLIRWRSHHNRKLNRQNRYINIFVNFSSRFKSHIIWGRQWRPFCNVNIFCIFSKNNIVAVFFGRKLFKNIIWKLLTWLFIFMHTRIIKNTLCCTFFVYYFWTN